MAEVIIVEKTDERQRLWSWLRSTGEAVRSLRRRSFSVTPFSIFTSFSAEQGSAVLTTSLENVKFVDL